MKGVFFTRFLQMVGERYSDDLVDKIIDASDLSTDGAYTSIGAYSHRELVQLVTHLSKETGIDVSALLESFGHYLLQHSPDFYTDYFSKVDNSFDFVKAIDGHTDLEEENIYLEAERTFFKVVLLNENSSELSCISKRPFAKFIAGMIKECRTYYKNNIEQGVIDNSNNEALEASFLIK